MKTAKIILPVAYCLSLFTCATPEKYKTICNSWVGAPMDALFTQWGKPDISYLLSTGEMVVQYQRWNSDIHAINPSGYCKTRFIIREGRINRWNFDGACYSE